MRDIKTSFRIFDSKRKLVILPTAKESVEFAAHQFMAAYEKAIKDHGFFSVALSGGSTPKAIYRLLASDPYREAIDWKKVLIFFSDERAVPPDHPESNYRMALESGFSFLPIEEDQIFRMKAEGSMEVEAKAYEEIMDERLYKGKFDLMMLGLGEDAHTASLFPKTHALNARERKVVGNFVPKLNAWRMSLTFSCINEAREILIVALGKSKARAVEAVFFAPYDPNNYPAQGIGTPENNSLWVLDYESAGNLRNQI
ncbi:6-phosphogluconolactonase [Criblamydia sequanensis]|uniref:6-phosphogluconolactonase n=1 Tax=Candidatus Criblamydia sequanensis CRIB-18 TaxID=1437425 RepID=A0A090D1L6_9BACT|nr:6-phosphogluconolactonase [Criblamydia sequanensis]CDR33603.1 6-phosphogluconolactonase [Criblamydia sequanensis CRIB-18]